MQREEKREEEREVKGKEGKKRKEKKEDVEANIPIAITARYGLSCDTLILIIHMSGRAVV